MEIVLLLVPLVVGFGAVSALFGDSLWRKLQRASKRCPDCTEEVERGARVCRSCGFSFSPTLSPASRR
jgi:predicted amidophosphoribosyltransferase